MDIKALRSMLAEIERLTVDYSALRKENQVLRAERDHLRLGVESLKGQLKERRQRVDYLESEWTRLTRMLSNCVRPQGAVPDSAEKEANKAPSGLSGISSV